MEVLEHTIAMEVLVVVLVKMEALTELVTVVMV
jgi:hypothetical protein